MKAPSTVDHTRTLMSSAEEAWWAAASQARGLFSPIQGRYSLTFGGGLLALEKAHGVDTAPIAASPEDVFCKTLDKDGRTWHAKRYGGFLVFAWRDLDDLETAELIEDRIDSRCAMVPSVCLRAARYIAWHIKQLGQHLTPAKPMPRSERRFLKRRLLALAELQSELLVHRPRNSREIAQRMKAIGVYWEPVDYQAWLDRQHA